MKKHEKNGKNGSNGKPVSPNSHSSHPIIPPRGDYKTLHSFNKAEVVYDITFRFAHKYLAKGDRTIDQMIQSARSGKKNVLEGSKAGRTSSDQAIKTAFVRPLALFLCIAAIFLSGCGKDSTSQAKHKSKYPVLTVEILKGIPDKDLEGAIMDHVESKMAGHWDDEYKIVTGLSKGFQIIYSTRVLEGEVYNGGFNQYFWNSSGQFQKEALEGYKVLGAKEYVTIVEEAIKIYAGEAERLKPFKEKDTIQSFSESYKNDPLGPCDDKFYKLKTDLSTTRVKYIREHVEEFVDK